MNRDEPRGANQSASGSSTSYLLYLFLVSAVLVAMLPSFGRIFLPSGSNKTLRISPSRARSSSVYSTLLPDTVMRRVNELETKLEALEVLVLDLQEVLNMEMETTLHLENEISVLQMSDMFLKDRLHHSELRNPNFDSRMHLLRDTVSSQGKQEELHSLLHDFTRVLQMEKARMAALELQVERMRESEAALTAKVEVLEVKLRTFMGSQRQFNENKTESEQGNWAAG